MARQKFAIIACFLASRCGVLYLGFDVKKSYWIAGCFLGVLACAGIYRAVQTPSAPTAARPFEQKLPAPKLQARADAGSYWHDEEVQSGDTLQLILARLGMDAKSVQAFEQQSPIDLKALQLRAGQIVSVRVNEEQEVSDVQFFNDDDGERNLIALEYRNGKWQLHTGAVDTETLPSLRSVVITSSASGALAKAGVPIEIRTALKEMFADKFDWNSLQAGDSIRVLYESLYFRGQEVATGNVLAAEVSTQGATYYAYYYEHGDAGGNFYDETGNALQKGFAGQPIEHYTRISSPYGIRIHPVLKTVRMHTGIDYAAPHGTKVLAPSDGVVRFRGWKGGYGNAVILAHGNGLETLYGHLSAFISGVEEGTSVQAGDVIGLVGSTGRSTGPHLHYEVRIDGQHVNPATIALPTPVLSAQDLATLQGRQRQIQQLMQSVRGLPVPVSQKN